ncbi:protein PBDC1-like [Actinia tenebrosa]|uniref:Protein PBDC1-like n=1 Tax=Actinia tenebrosa TaxID=6105 RepID=A0A6P8JCP1_ACTTE|nr:protein PBDC1-like [Actinia tenebrosa]
MDKKNNPEVEVAWAIKAHTHAETYFKLISAFDSSKLKLTNYDDDIYRQFKRYFKTLQVKVIKEEEFKSEIAKARWRPFCNLFKNKVEDYNFGTLLRIDCDKGYNEENTILVTRIQFLAVEIARNRRHLNNLHIPKQSPTEDENQER